MALIRLTVEVPQDADERQLGDVREFCRVVTSVAHGFGHKVIVARPGSDVMRDEDLVVAVPISFSSVTEEELAAARDSNTPVFVLLPDHLAVPATVRKNPLVVDVKKWWGLGAAIEQVKRFLGQYQGTATVN